MSIRNDRLRVAFPIWSQVNAIDPHSIQAAGPAIISQNVFSKLVTFSNNGQIQGELATDFYWDGEGYSFTIEPITTADGYSIGAEDAYYSLKRIVALDKNTHGSLKQFICPDTKITRLTDPCEGLSWSGNTLRIVPAQPVFRQHILPLIGAVDYSILRKSDLDLDNPSLLKIDWRNTSGPYYLTNANSSTALLSLNSRHPLASQSNFKELEIVSLRNDHAISEFKAGRVDFITTIGGVGRKEIQEFQNSGKVFTHVTLPMHLHYFHFLAPGMEELNSAERHALGLFLRRRLLAANHENEITPTHEFFPADGPGRITEEQNDSLNEIKDTAKEVDLNKLRVRLIVPKHSVDKFREMFKDAAFLHIEEPDGPPWVMAQSRQPHLYYGLTDSGYSADLPLLSYNISVETFADKKTGQDWLSNYWKIDDEAERMRAINQLHFKALRDARIVPVFMDSYIAVSRLPVKFTLSRFYANNYFTQIRSID
ncbi:MAG: hypothetical protein H6626_10845 [Pseudobdellovibrionaceae bacterium]|nr:MAG: hypothetical protein H6626_10845 [Pseudobdellovibrionaceae bacterium]